MRRAVALLASLGSLCLSAVAHAQRPSPTLRRPEPLLVDTPWGDFPLERLQPGARLRLIGADGRRVEVRVDSLEDSTLALRSPHGAPIPSMTFADLRALRAVEVRARPAWHDRAANVGFVAGAALGGAAGAVHHNARRSSGRKQPGLGEDVAQGASLGFLVGWITGGMLIGGERWRPVTLP